MKNLTVLRGKFDKVLTHLGGHPDFLMSMRPSEYFQQVNKDLDRICYFNPNGTIAPIKELAPLIDHLVDNNDEIKPLCFTQGQFEGCVIYPTILAATGIFDDKNATKLSEIIFTHPDGPLVNRLSFCYLNDDSESTVNSLCAFDISIIRRFELKKDKDQENKPVLTLHDDYWFSITIVTKINATPSERELTVILHPGLYEYLRKNSPFTKPLEKDSTQRNIKPSDVISEIEKVANSRGLTELIGTSGIFNTGKINVTNFSRLSDRISANANLDNRDNKSIEFQTLIKKIERLAKNEPADLTTLKYYIETEKTDINFYENERYSRTMNILRDIFSQYEDTISEESTGNASDTPTANRGNTPQEVVGHPDLSPPTIVQRNIVNQDRKTRFQINTQQRILLITALILTIAFFSILILTVPAIATLSIAIKLASDIIASSTVFAGAFFIQRQFEKYSKQKKSNEIRDSQNTHRMIESPQQHADSTGSTYPLLNHILAAAELPVQSDQPRQSPDPVFYQLKELIAAQCAPNTNLDINPRQPNLVEYLRIAAADQNTNTIDAAIEKIVYSIQNQSIAIKPVMLGRLKDALEELEEKYFNNKTSITRKIDRLLQPHHYAAAQTLNSSADNLSPAPEHGAPITGTTVPNNTGDLNYIIQGLARLDACVTQSNAFTRRGR